MNFSDFLRESMRHLDDQTIFWEGLRHGVYGSVNPLEVCSDYVNTSSVDSVDSLITCPLDGCQFAAGALSNYNDYFAWKNLMNGLQVLNCIRYVNNDASLTSMMFDCRR
jgi:hypothetical protein